MTDREKVIKAIEDALSLLKAQEPVAPLVAGRGKSFETAETWWYHWKNLMACGLLQEEQDGIDNP